VCVSGGECEGLKGSGSVRRESNRFGSGHTQGMTPPTPPAPPIFYEGHPPPPFFFWVFRGASFFGLIVSQYVCVWVMWVAAVFIHIVCVFRLGSDMGLPAPPRFALSEQVAVASFF